MRARRTISFSSLRINPNEIEDKSESEWIFEPGCVAANDWLADINYCPRCLRNPLTKRSKRYCLICDRSGLDGRVELPGLPINYAPNLEFKNIATPTKTKIGPKGTIEYPKRRKLSIGQKEPLPRPVARKTTTNPTQN